MNKNDNTYVLTWAKKLKAIDLLGGKCEHCGEKDIFKLCFHHKNPDEKEFAISVIANYRWSKIKKEVSKCQLLCHNCHSEYHNNIIDETTYRMKNKLIYLEFKNKFKCSDCGYNKNNSALSFHHKDKKDKGFDINKISKPHKSIYDISIDLQIELDKCDVLCMNCHAKRHIDIDRFNALRNEIHNRMYNHKEVQAPLDKNKILELYNGGMRQKEIVDLFKCTKSTISMIIKKYNKIH
tara:strand:+ start:18786 stop:19496 length:711 start_codon:yes stop_codon:yes gene_type:complete